MKLLEKQCWQEMETKEELMSYFAVHCGACAQIFLDTKSLVKNVFQRDFQARWTLDFDQDP